MDGRVARRRPTRGLRGHSPRVVLPPDLLTDPEPPVNTVRVVVVTGPPGCGKTPVVAAVANELARQGVPMAGFVQPAVVEHGRKTGYRLRDAVTGQEAMLARRVRRGHGWTGTAFDFDPKGFALAACALERAAPGAVLIVDELGPVEVGGGGHWPALAVAMSRIAPRGLLVVIRRTLVASLLEKLDVSDAVVIDLETVRVDVPGASERRDDGRFTVEEIVAWLTS
jgi:nucleoside-triphosphatase